MKESKLPIDTIKTETRAGCALLLLLALLLAACKPQDAGPESTIAALNTTIAEQAEELAALEALASQPPPTATPSPTHIPRQMPTVVLPSPEPVLTVQRPPTATPSPLPTATATATATSTPIPDAAVGDVLTNLRSGPGVGFEVLSEVAAGTPLDLLGKSADGEWLKVRIPDGQEGWMFYLPVRLTVSPDAIPVLEE